MRAPDYQNTRYRLWVMKQGLRDDVRVTHLKIRDRFSRVRHRPERLAFGIVVRQIERHLQKRPHIDFDHPKNRVRRLIYLPRTMKAWSVYMPGGFATYPAHNPDVRRLHSGARIDYLTRNLFRHSIDAIGLRSRAYAMSWYALRQLSDIKKRRVRWLSIAAGTGQPTYEAAALLPRQPNITLCDINTEALAFAKELAKVHGLADRVTTQEIDITKRGALRQVLEKTRPDVIDMMGLMEYLDDETIVRLLRTFKQTAATQTTLIFTNMRPTHPQLATHKRGLGWPGVCVRTIDEMTNLITKAGVNRDTLEVLLPDDKVYAIYCIKRP